MKNDKLVPKVLSYRIITGVTPAVAAAFGLSTGEKSMGLFTADNDDIGYIALDDATKKANIRVIYCGSMYAGATNANTLLAGEVFAAFVGNNVSDVKAGMDAILSFFEGGIHLVSCNDDDSIMYLAYTVSRIGSYFAYEYDVDKSESVAYCVAPPLESVFAVDATIKIANVRIAALWKPPTHTNFGGALFAGAQADCASACTAFGNAVQDVADACVLS
jgi:ethanolamine utilization protein EutL